MYVFTCVPTDGAFTLNDFVTGACVALPHEAGTSETHTPTPTAAAGAGAGAGEVRIRGVERGNMLPAEASFAFGEALRHSHSNAKPATTTATATVTGSSTGAFAAAGGGGGAGGTGASTHAAGEALSACRRVDVTPLLSTWSTLHARLALLPALIHSPRMGGAAVGGAAATSTSSTRATMASRMKVRPPTPSIHTPPYPTPPPNVCPHVYGIHGNVQV